MRFDDSLKTILSADMSSGFGAASAWRQLVDLMGRGRIASDAPTVARLRMLRQAVPIDVRAASGRALAFAAPDAALVGFFAEDEPVVAAPVLRTAVLPATAWETLLPRLTPVLRSVLRHRRDLPVETVRALATFGSVDFLLGGDTADADAGTVAAPEVAVELPEIAIEIAPKIAPKIAKALRREPPPTPPGSSFAISDLVARIEAFTRSRGAGRSGSHAASPAGDEEERDSFRYATDPAGTISWVENIARGTLIGVSFDYAARQGLVQFDGVVGGAFRRRSRFASARLSIDGDGPDAGSWRLDGVPIFDRRTGRFTGYRGSGRRPRIDESAEPARRGAAASDALRQLVHELRTPSNAIAGFAEMIEDELFGPVAPVYRQRAGTIRAQSSDLVAAIDDLDLAARIDGGALALRAEEIAPVPLIARLLADLSPLTRVRGAQPVFDATRSTQPVAADERALERLLGRLLAALIAAAGHGERIAIEALDHDGAVVVTLGRPVALEVEIGDTLFSLDGAEWRDEPGAPLLGTAFALRLARNLAGELGGALAIDADRLTLRLPAADRRDMAQATTL